jgi:hypothetical protein
MSFRDRFGAEGRSVTLLTAKYPLSADGRFGVRMMVGMVAIYNVQHNLIGRSLEAPILSLGRVDERHVKLLGDVDVQYCTMALA